MVAEDYQVLDSGQTGADSNLGKVGPAGQQLIKRPQNCHSTHANARYSWRMNSKLGIRGTRIPSSSTPHQPCD